MLLVTTPAVAPPDAGNAAVVRVPSAPTGGTPGNNGWVTAADSDAVEQTSPTSDLDPQIAARLRRDPDGLLPAVIQQHTTREVLMVGWMDDEALHRTLTTGWATFWSRSRGEYWVKGETSGNRQQVDQVLLDCDGDTLLVVVSAAGPACHTGTWTCFDDRRLAAAPQHRDRIDHSETS